MNSLLLRFCFLTLPVFHECPFSLAVQVPLLPQLRSGFCPLLLRLRRWVVVPRFDLTVLGQASLRIRYTCIREHPISAAICVGVMPS